MGVFTKLFGEFLVFVYHCFDRIVVHGYLTALSRPELVVHFFRDIVGVAEVSKEVLSQRTNAAIIGDCSVGRDAPLFASTMVPANDGAVRNAE